MESQNNVLTQPFIPSEIVKESTEQEENIEFNEKVCSASSICASVLREDRLISSSKRSRPSKPSHDGDGTRQRSNCLRSRSRSDSRGSKSNSRSRSRSGSNRIRSDNRSDNRIGSGSKPLKNCSRSRSRSMSKWPRGGTLDHSGSKTSKNRSRSISTRSEYDQESRSRSISIKKNRKNKTSHLKPNSHSDAHSTSHEEQAGARLNKRPKITDTGNVDKEQAEINTSENGNVNILYTEKSSDADVGPTSNNGKNDEFISDFDAMLLYKKQLRIARGRKFDTDLNSKDDDLIAQLIWEMKSAFDEDRQLKLCGKIATKKISILKIVMSQLIKKDLQLSFIEHNVLDVLAEWLAPLPDNTLPCYNIRESILKLLLDFPTIDKIYLKRSGIVKAVKYLSRHPDETEENRKRAADLVTKWDRWIFYLNDDLQNMTREERQERELAQMPKLRKSCEPKPTTSTERNVTFKSAIVGKNQPKSSETSLVTRARFPSPSRKEYVIRPNSNFEGSVKNARTKPNRVQKYIERFIYLKQLNQPKPIAGLSIDGRKM